MVIRRLLVSKINHLFLNLIKNKLEKPLPYDTLYKIQQYSVGSHLEATFQFANKITTAKILAGTM